MTTELSSIIAIVSTCISASALTLSLYVIHSERRQKKFDNLVSIQEFLHKDELSDARRKIWEGKIEIMLSNDEIRRVCSSFDFAGVLIRHKAINETIFIDYWGSMLSVLDEAFAPLADQLTGKGVRVRDYYKDFWWLMSRAHTR